MTFFHPAPATSSSSWLLPSLPQVGLSDIKRLVLSSSHSATAPRSYR